jgi:hypothetical protein
VAGKPTVNRYLAPVRAILLRSRDEWEWIDKVPKVKLFKETLAHLAPDRLATADSRIDSLIGGYDLATQGKDKRQAKTLTS